MQQKEKPKKLTTLEELSTLVNTGKWPQALRLVRSPGMKSAYETDVHYWFQRALVESLSGSEESVIEEARQQARACPGYNKGIEEDLVRDHALACIRRRMLDKAMELRDQARKLSNPEDGNRVAALEMLDGRIAYALGDPGKAATHFIRAHDMWRKLKKSGEHYSAQWIINNRFYLLKALAALGEATGDITFIVVSTDPSLKRRLSARFIGRFGKLGNRIHDWVAYQLGL